MAPTTPKRVQFSHNVEFISTFTDEEYDRSAQDVAKLTYNDMMELLTMKLQWRQDTSHRLAQRKLEEQASEQLSGNDAHNSEQQCAFGSSPYEICA